jgi:hypothetical protein
MRCEECGESLKNKADVIHQLNQIQEKAMQILESRHGLIIPIQNSEELLELFEEAICEIYG